MEALREESGLTVEDLLVDLPEQRAALYRERHGHGR
jgi:hypothetical protein